MRKIIISIMLCLCLTGCSESKNIDGTTNMDNSNEIWL